MRIIASSLIVSQIAFKIEEEIKRIIFEGTGAVKRNYLHLQLVPLMMSSQSFNFLAKMKKDYVLMKSGKCWIRLIVHIK